MPECQCRHWFPRCRRTAEFCNKNFLKRRLNKINNKKWEKHCFLKKPVGTFESTPFWKWFFKVCRQKVPWPGFEPGLLRPQRRVLTTRRSRLHENIWIITKIIQFTFLYYKAWRVFEDRVQYCIVHTCICTVLCRGYLIICILLHTV